MDFVLTPGATPPLNRTTAPQVGLLEPLGKDFRPGNQALHLPGDSDQGNAELAEGWGTLARGEIDKSDIDGDTRQIPDEKIDSRPAIPDEDGLLIDQGQDPQEQFCLSKIGAVDHRIIPSRSRGTMIRYFASYRPFGTIIRFPAPRSTFDRSSLASQGSSWFSAM